MTKLGRYFSRRWSGQVSWQTLLWPDILGVGTVLNLTATLVALVAAIQGVHVAVVALLHFAPLPFNLFLVAALWRAPRRPAIAAGVALAWLVVMVLV